MMENHHIPAHSCTNLQSSPIHKYCHFGHRISTRSSEPNTQPHSSLATLNYPRSTRLSCITPTTLFPLDWFQTLLTKLKPHQA
ncbi:hypothetical protein Hanom_Chr05g00426281 [Helianthus anomalus]